MNNHCYINEDYICSIAPVLRGFYRLRHIQQTKSDIQTPLKNTTETLTSKYPVHRRNHSDMPVPSIQVQAFKPQLEIMVSSRYSSREPKAPTRLHKKLKPDSSHAFFPYKASPKLLIKKQSKLKTRKKSAQFFKRSLNSPQDFEIPDSDTYKIHLQELQGKKVVKGPKLYNNQIFFDVFDDAGNHDRMLDTLDEPVPLHRHEYILDNIPSTKVVYSNHAKTHTENNYTLKRNNGCLQVPGNSLTHSPNSNSSNEIQEILQDNMKLHQHNLNFKLEQLINSKHKLKDGMRYA